ncbi:MAG: hypothetical protein H5U02_08610 [Clostridia bacterium]|nr:hypothetical protein [Clostridia bacterium]
MPKPVACCGSWGRSRAAFWSFPHQGGHEGRISLEIIRVSSKVEPRIEAGRLGITVKVEEEGNIGEQMANADLTQPQQFQLLEQANPRR